jgi:hypothetical protein
VGEFIILALGFALPAWQHFLVACACINAAALLLYPFVSESPRWLLSRGRTEEGMAVLQSIAKVNQKQLRLLPQCRVIKTASQRADHSTSQHDVPSPQAPRDVPQSLEGLEIGAGMQDGATAGSEVRLWPLLKQRAFAVRLLVLLLNWFGLMLNYYGISMGSGGISGSM